MLNPLALTKEDYQVIWRERCRQEAKIAVLMTKDLSNPITAAALRRHELIREALIRLYHESYYNH